jgi:hypothetical protein
MNRSICGATIRKRLNRWQLPGRCVNAHGRVIELNGVLIAGFEGSPRYRPGPHQYREWQMQLMTRKLPP